MANRISDKIAAMENQIDFTHRLLQISNWSDELDAEVYDKLRLPLVNMIEPLSNYENHVRHAIDEVLSNEEGKSDG